jgi:hypothetical protein
MTGFHGKHPSAATCAVPQPNNRVLHHLAAASGGLLRPPASPQPITAGPGWAWAALLDGMDHQAEQDKRAPLGTAGGSGIAMELTLTTPPPHVVLLSCVLRRSDCVRSRSTQPFAGRNQQSGHVQVLMN